MKSRTWLIAFVATWFCLASNTFADEARQKEIALETVRERSKECGGCLLFAKKDESPLIRKNALYLVSTLDRIPPPIWTVAVSKEAKGFILSAQDLSGWNQMIRGEALSLASDPVAGQFAQEFVRLVIGKAIYIPKLTDVEAERVRKKRGSVPMSETKIQRSASGVSIFFYAKDIGGALQLWNLETGLDGRLLKVDAIEF